jgi:hypothetical protein
MSSPALKDLEDQLLCLAPGDKLHLIQVLAESLTTLWEEAPPSSPEKLSEFFQQSPLADVVAQGEIDLKRDRRLDGDRFIP